MPLFRVSYFCSAYLGWKTPKTWNFVLKNPPKATKLRKWASLSNFVTACSTLAREWRCNAATSAKLWKTVKSRRTSSLTFQSWTGALSTYWWFGCPNMKSVLSSIPKRSSATCKNPRTSGKTWARGTNSCPVKSWSQRRSVVQTF